jgi:YVTN family beta-propeller protein
MVEDPHGRWLAVSNGGYGQNALFIIDERTGKVASSLTLKAAFYGLAFGSSKLYASTAFGVEGFTVSTDGAVADAGPLLAASPDFGITGITAANGNVYVADGAHNRVVALNEGGATLWSARLRGWPYAIVTSKDGKTLYVSDWTDAAVVVLDASSGAIKTTIAAGNHPNAMVLSSNGSNLYVACANDDTVKVIDAPSNTVRATINTGIFTSALPGAIPNGLAITADGTILLVADAGENSVVAIDLSSNPPAVFGAIPTGWWPTDVIASGDGRKLFILDGKGVAGHANPTFIHSSTATSASPGDYKYYVANTAGDIEMLDLPDRSTLAAGLNAVRFNSAYSPREVASRIPPEGLHVIYIIKENRTYDEVLGDDPRGNGDAHLAIFGRRITPNIHKLADDFALLDNFDTDAFVSADGHNWSTAAFANDYVDKLWPATYSDRRVDGGKRVYDYEEGGPAAPPGGYLWDDARRNGVTVRDYGEYVITGRRGISKPSVASLDGLVDPHYPGFDLGYPDIDRIADWQREFAAYVARHDLPQLEILRLPNDHTAAMRPGARSPYAMVADNDYALGRLVETVSKSPYWKDTLIFSVEDDAQAGPDHVSDHRAEVLVIGARIKRGVVDHTHYTTASVLRTIEEILGLPPMTQYDAGATTMFRLQAETPDTRPWTAERSNVNLNDVNPPSADGKTSQAMDLSRADAADSAQFNAMLYRYAKSHPAP